MDETYNSQGKYKLQNWLYKRWKSKQISSHKKKKKGKVTKELPTIVAAGLDCLLWGILPKL